MWTPLRAASRARAGRDSGAATVEFALLLVPLLLILFGIVDFGRAYNMQISMTQAAREGVRVLVIEKDPAAATARTQQAAFPVTGMSVSTAGCPTTVTTTTPPARVTVTRTYDYITPLGAMVSLAGGSLSTPLLRGEGYMRCTG